MAWRIPWQVESLHVTRPLPARGGRTRRRPPLGRLRQGVRQWRRLCRGDPEDRAPVDARRQDGEGRPDRRARREAEEERREVRPAGEQGPRQHGPAQGRRAETGDDLLLPLLAQGRQERPGYVPHRAECRFDEEGPLRVHRRRRRGHRPRDRRSPSARSRSTGGWRASATTSTSTSATSSTRTARVPGGAVALTVAGQMGQVPAQPDVREPAPDPRRHRALQPLGRPRVHRRLLDLPSTGFRPVPVGRKAFLDYSPAVLGASTGSTATTGGARTSRSSSSTSARSAASRRRPTRRARTRRPASRTRSRSFRRGCGRS